ncbi:MAG TPA: lysylphosphatidylglycerol synthase domain-containing protein [Pseudonocardiaceae bacterium]
MDEPERAASAPEDTPESAAAPAAPQSRGVKSQIIAWARRVVVLAVVVYAAYQLVEQWHEVSKTLLALPPLTLVLSFVALFVGIFLGPVVWQTMLSDLGAPVKMRDAAKVYLVGQLGKYVPGSVVAFLMQMELAKAVGVNRARSFTASLLAAGLAVVASLIAGMCALPAFFRGNHELLWLFLLLPIGLAFLHPKLLTWLVSRVLRLLRRAPLPYPISVGAIVKGVVVSLGIYVALGVHMYLLISSLGHHGFGALVLCVGAMGLAMTAGLVAFFLPSGIGARELVIVTALVTVMPYGQALALAVVSRLMFTVGDLASAGGAALFAQLRRRQAAVADSAPVGA